MSETLKPSISILCKLGSLAIHDLEFNGPNRDALDLIAAKQILTDPEVVEWLEQMQKIALITRPRIPISELVKAAGATNA